MRAVRTRVLPLPAPAKMRSGPSPWVTASCCGGLRRASSASIWAWEDSETTGESSLPMAGIGLPRRYAPHGFGTRNRSRHARPPPVRAGARLSSSLDLDTVLAKVMDRVITLMRASRGFIVLVDQIDGSLSVQMSSGSDPE